MRNIFITVLFFLVGFSSTLAQADFSIGTTCGSGSVNYAVTTGSPPYLWDFGDGSTLTTTTSAISKVYTNPGVYTIRLTVSGGSFITKTFVVPAKPVFGYGRESLCLSTELAASITGINPSPLFSGLNGRYAPGLGLGSYFNPLTGRITYNIGISSGSYPISYTYSVAGCGNISGSTLLGIGNATIGPFTGEIQLSGQCNRVRLVKSVLARGSLQWQISNTFTGGAFEDLPIITEPNTLQANDPTVNSSNADFYLTPTLTVTSQIRLQLSDLYCGILDNSQYDQLFTIAGLTDPGVLSTPTPVTCQNYAPTVFLDDYRGQVKFEYSLDGTNYINSSGLNASILQTKPGIVGGTFDATHAPVKDIFSISGNYFFRAEVNYTQYGVLGSCETIYSNVITITAEFCTVTSAILNTTTSPICLSQASVPGVFFDESSILTGTTASITGWRWDFGNAATPSVSNTTTPVFPTVRYNSAANSIKNISLTLLGTGFMYVTSTTIQVDAFTNQTEISPPASNVTVCSGNFVTLLVNSTNSNPAIQWQSSPDANLSNYSNVSTVGNGETARQYTTPGLSNTIFYRATVQNGVCPMLTTAGRSLTVIQPLTISPAFDQPIITICEGNNAVLSASGVNGNINFLTATTYGGIYNTAAGTNLSNGIFRTNFLTTADDYFFKARISNAFGCSSAESGIYTISVVSCPILANFSVNGTFFSDKACLNSSNFSFNDITPTIAGVRFANWNWNFGSGATQAAISTVSGNAVSSNYSTEGVKQINLTITGVAGSKTYIGSNFVTVTIDGLSNASTISADYNPICESTTTGLSFITTNANPQIQWEQSTTGWNLIANATTTSYLPPALASSTGFRAMVTNGVCPSTYTPQITISVLPSPSVTLLGSYLLTVCDGAKTNLSIAAQNYASIEWQEAPFPSETLFTTTTGIGITTLNFTTDFLANQSYYFRAKMMGRATCESIYTNIITVSGVECPILPIISVTSAFFAQRTCFSDPKFFFRDITPTVSGVTFVKWVWDFTGSTDLNTFSTSIAGINPPQKNYNLYADPDDNFTIYNATLSITGVSGNKTIVYASNVVLTVDGLPSILNFRDSDSDHQICVNTTPGENNLVLFDNKYPADAEINWHLSTNNTNYQDLTFSGSNYEQPIDQAGAFSFYATAKNGVCPIFNTTSTSFVTNTITSQPIIYSFSYSEPAFCNSLTTVSPIINANGTYAGASFSKFPINIIISSNGVINPSQSVPDSYTITYNIPPTGGCLADSRFTNVVIGKDPIIPDFFYPISPICNNSTAFPSPDFTSMPAGSYNVTTLGFPISTFTGVISLDETVPTGVFEIEYKTTALNGCVSKTSSTILSVTGLPSQHSFAYDKISNCNSRGTIPLLSSTGINFNDPNEGIWTINNNPINTTIGINTTTGDVIVTTEAPENFYFVKYSKFTSGGCASIKVEDSQPILLFEIPKTPVFQYGTDPSYCTNSDIPVPTGTNIIGGQFKSFSEEVEIQNIVSGKIKVGPENLGFSGVAEIQYQIAAGFVCPSVAGTAFVNFTGIPAPEIQYSNTLVCNEPTTLLYPSGGVNTIGGTYRIRNFASNPLAIDPISGVITVTSATIQDLYTVDYIVTIAGCGISSVTSPGIGINIQDKADQPYFSYSSDPICQKQFQLVDKSNLFDPNFVSSNPSLLLVDPKNGNLIRNNDSDGIYSITGFNNSKPVFIGSIATNICPPTGRIVVVTIGSQVVIPNFSYGSSGLFCNDADFARPSVTLSGGNFSSNNPGSLVFNSITGIIDLKTSVPSTYEITYNINAANACFIEPKTANITIDALPEKQNFAYPQANYCQGGGLGGLPEPFGLPNLPTGGYYSISPLSDAISTATGVISLESIIAGPKEIRYISPGKNACPNVASDPAVININLKPQVPFLNYGSTPICIDTIKKVVPTALYVAANATFSGSSFVNTDGSLTLTDLTRGQFAQYAITVVNPSEGNCVGLQNTFIITISSPIATPQFNYFSSVFCRSGDVRPDVGPVIPVNGYFESFSSNLIFKDDVSGTIDLEKSVPGKYKVYYKVPELNGCPAFNTPSDSFSIVAPSIGVIKSEQSKGFICGGNGVELEISDYMGTLSWQQRNWDETAWNNLSMIEKDEIFSTEALFDTTYIRAQAKLNECPDTASNSLRIKVIRGSKGGTASSNENTNFKEICNELQTDLKLEDYVGGIIWQFSKDSLFWDDVSSTDTLAKFTTPSQNEYGLKIWYRAAVTNETCPADFSSRVLVKICDKENFIPNVLTPNSSSGGDEKSSSWRIEQLNLRDFAEVRIFNRYGSQVYFANGRDASNNPWDGGGLPAGTYYYVIDRKDQTKPLTGSVSIVK